MSTSLKTEQALDAGDLVITVKAIKRPGLIFSSEAVPKGTPGVVLARKNRWLKADELTVRFENGEIFGIDVGENYVVGVGEF